MGASGGWRASRRAVRSAYESKGDTGSPLPSMPCLGNTSKILEAVVCWHTKNLHHSITD